VRFHDVFYGLEGFSGPLFLFSVVEGGLIVSLIAHRLDSYTVTRDADMLGLRRLDQMVFMHQTSIPFHVVPLMSLGTLE
jgi:hypothetical protein